MFVLAIWEGDRILLCSGWILNFLVSKGDYLAYDTSLSASEDDVWE